ncbi:hypothetical protein CPB83DRAFT_854480 [Crepidotus variabilis]|uniref:Uncharacterized protein n=1 Tax=Crepidotus variabilis TaxID=179855 RepID=A0A9P6JQ05_9AGAR|nr:hypothetical protein CPB83DRAFT_854480 [Crepidotus variabilis]
MVQVKSAAVALILIAPSLALPVQNIDARSNELDTREPNPEPRFNIGGIFKAAKKIAHNPGVRKAASVASWFIREDGTSVLSARDLADLDDISERDLEELAARDPRFGSFLKKFRGIAGKIGKVAGPAARIASNFIREEDDDLFAREDLLDLLDISERDFDELEELAARDPKFRFGKIFKKIKGVVGKVAKFAGPAAKMASNFIREEDVAVYAREDVSDFLDLSERELDEMEELAARDPKFGKFFKKIKGFAGKVGRFAGPAANMASNFIREEYDDEVFSREEMADMLDISERDLEEMEELAARDPKFGSFFKKIKGAFKKVAKFAAPVMRVASNFIREESDLDEILARDYDFDLLD